MDITGTACHLRIALVCEGDASRSETAFSGTAKRIFETLLQCGHEVIPVDASLTGLKRASLAAMSVSVDKLKWRSRFRYGNQGAKLRAAAAQSSLGQRSADIILQIGTTYDPPRSGSAPYAIYCDWTMALTAAEAKAKSGKSNGLSLGEIEAIDEEHARRYRGAAAIFTISERLRKSIIELYDIAPEKVHTAYAGPNFDIRLIDQTLLHPKESSVPTVLFIAKEFERKGGATVASAFARLRESIPTARLLFAGSANLPTALAAIGNVEHLGLLDKSDPHQLLRLLAAYRSADLFVLPSLRDPFPTVIREAMFFGLPCIASDIWAMPEMIVEGETGFLVPVNDPELLCARMTILLEDGPLRLEMGKAARARAEAMFSWRHVGDVLSTVLDQSGSRH